MRRINARYQKINPCGRGGVASVFPRLGSRSAVGDISDVSHGIIV